MWMKGDYKHVKDLDIWHQFKFSISTQNTHQKSKQKNQTNTKILNFL